MFGLDFKTSLPSAEQALPGRDRAVDPSASHYVSGRPLLPPYPAGTQEIVFGMGCFWGAERRFWQLPGVWLTAVGYAGGATPNPTYEEVCSGGTGHAEVVRVVFDPARVELARVLREFWEGHDPTQGMRQGNDRGTQYRSIILTDDAAQRSAAEQSRAAYAAALAKAGYGPVTTDIAAGPFYFAEAYHQQYLAKHPGGYCGLGGTGVSCPAGLDVAG